MMLKSILLAAGLAVAALSAQAATMKAVWTGTLFDQDTVSRSVAQGMFGYDDFTLLAGLSYRAEAIYDTSRGTRTTNALLDSVDSPTGALDSERVIRSAKMTINGVTFDFPVTLPIFNRALVRISDQGVAYVHQILGFTGSSSIAFTLNGTFVSNAAPDLEAPASQADSVFGFGRFRINLSPTSFTTAYLRAETLTIAPIPLPATLPLALAALAGLGFVARRRAGREAKGA